MTTDEWEKRITETFSVDGLIGEKLRLVLDDEASVSEVVLRQFHGQDVLLSAFQGFFFETLKMAISLVEKDG